MEGKKVDEVTLSAINTIRTFAAEMPSVAKSGHPGAPIGLAPTAFVLWSKMMRYNPSNPHWFNRDRFVLSNGHACALQYTMLHLTGYPLTLDDIKAFRQAGSKTPGHPESHITPGIEVTTGPLGQGIAAAVGLAIAEKNYSAVYNKPGFPIVDNKVWVVVGDGCLQEGVSSEASSIAGHLGLGNLKVIYDDNHITIDGDTKLSFTEEVIKRYQSYGWATFNVADGNHDVDGITKAFEEACKVTDRPCLINISTTIGYGTPKAGTKEVHGSPLSAAELSETKKFFGFDPEKQFFVPKNVDELFKTFKARGEAWEKEWNDLLERYTEKHPDLAKELKRRIKGDLPVDWDKNLPTSSPSDKPLATRQLSGVVINKIAEKVPELIGGSADLNPSTITYLKNSTDFQKETPEGRNIRFGVREHAMAAICNGLSAYGGVISFNSTFLNFIGYAWGAVVISALSHLRVIYIMTHDSIGLGEDGPTHQPVEKFMMCRITPNLHFIRPCDGNEVTASYISAMTYNDGPTVLAFSRQNLTPQKNSSIEGALKGAYPIHDLVENPELILVSTGSEVQLCSEAADKLKAEDGKRVRVVSMPSWELFDHQPQSYKEQVFTPGVPVVSVEAGVTRGWERYAHGSIGVDRFGLSGPTEQVYKALGITSENIVAKSKLALQYFTTNAVPPLASIKRPWDSAL